MKSIPPLPPRWLDHILSWFCKEEVLENIQGDLHEVYQKRVGLVGKRKANLHYLFDVVSILRPRLVKKSEGTRQLNQFGIFKNYLRTSIRNILHNSLFSGINVIGLAISMSVGILMIVVLSELNSFDDFHTKKDRIYRVTTSRDALFQGEAEFFATAPHYIAEQLEGRVSGVEQVLVLDRGFTADLKTENNGVAIEGYYASNSFFNVFSFKLKKGNPRVALENAGSIVLTESSAKKLFGDSDPINKTVNLVGNPEIKTGMITAIMEDPPANSHLQFDALVSMKTRSVRNDPGRYAQSYVYLVLKDGTDLTSVQSAMADLMANYNSSHAPITLLLQPMKDFVTSNADLQPGPVFSKQKVDMMIGLTLIVLLSACFNYTNLSLVRGLKRSKEICVRKITGANRLNVFLQFMTESILLSLLAMIVAVGLFLVIKPRFLLSIFSLTIVPLQLLYFLLFAIVVGCIAGFFPAFILSKLKASVLFNDASRVKLLSGVSARQILITCQIGLSIALTMCAVMSYKQYKYVLNYNLGYDTKNIVNITVPVDYIDVLETEYNNISGVEGTSKSSVILGTRNLQPADAMSEDMSDTILFSCNYIDDKYLDLHGFKLLAGKNVDKGIVVNEQFLKQLGLGSPDQAIGKYVWYFGEEKLTIEGVVGNFVSMSLDAEAPEAFGFMKRSAEGEGILGVKIAGGNLLTTLQELEGIYKKIDPVHTFEATFYDDQIARTYEDSKTTYTIISFLSFLAISISTLGLLGMAVFTIEMRLKEISIRKVLGAGIANLMLLLSRSFLTMIAIASVVAIPVSVYVVDDFLLNKFIYRTDNGFLEIISGLLIVLLIGILTVGWQVRIAATKNPADFLRDE